MINKFKKKQFVKLGSEDENVSQSSSNGLLQQVQAFGQNIGTAFQNQLQQFIPSGNSLLYLFIFFVYWYCFIFGCSGNKPDSGAAVPEAPAKQSQDSGEKEEATEAATATEAAEKNEEMTATE